jgi:hypothetical protein
MAGGLQRERASRRFDAVLAGEAHDADDGRAAAENAAPMASAIRGP